MTGPPPTVEVAVGAVVVHEDSILLVQRGRGVGAGLWSIPGGRVHFGEALTVAVAREVREETGLAVEVGQFIGWVERTGLEPDPYHFVILDFFASRIDPTAVPYAADDAADVRWVPRNQLNTVKLVPGLADFLVEAGVAEAGGSATPFE